MQPQFIAATRKSDGVLELVNTTLIARVYVNQDADPETVLMYADGTLVAYREHPSHFAPLKAWRDHNAG